MKLFDPLSEAINASLYSPADVTTGSTHVRDSINHKRVMSIILLALLPCVLMAIWNSGYQANLTLAQMLAAGQIDALPSLSNSASISNNMLKGLWLFLPMLIVVMIVQAFWMALLLRCEKRPSVPVFWSPPF